MLGIPVNLGANFVCVWVDDLENLVRKVWNVLGVSCEFGCKFCLHVWVDDLEDLVRKVWLTFWRGNRSVSCQKLLIFLNLWKVGIGVTDYLGQQLRCSGVDGSTKLFMQLAPYNLADVWELLD